MSREGLMQSGHMIVHWHMPCMACRQRAVPVPLTCRLRACPAAQALHDRRAQTPLPPGQLQCPFLCTRFMTSEVEYYRQVLAKVDVPSAFSANLL
eukprot:1145929-Pelagomonas_calceolata.AAC.5